MILGIESSCDDSCISLFCQKKGIIWEKKLNQHSLHKQYGGIVPYLAYLEHIKCFTKILKNLHKEIMNNKYNISQIAFTNGPGMKNSLLVGMGVASALSLSLNINQIVGINHLQGHAFSPFLKIYIENQPQFKTIFYNSLPHLGLIVSGGNTILFSISKLQKFIKIGETIDDSVGDALDKGARLLNLEYPGGKNLEKEALKGNPKKYYFPEAIVKNNDYSFSFSGVKTSLKYFLKKLTPIEINKYKKDIAASYQNSIFNALIKKVNLVLTFNNYQSLGLSGGVSNNKTLQKLFQLLALKRNIKLYIPKNNHTTDNASMIAFTAYMDKVFFKEKLTSNNKTLNLNIGIEG